MTRLSVILPNYNHAKYLAGALDAMLAQSRKPDEIVVIDDGSTDDSLQIIERYAAEHPEILNLPNGKNLGCMATLNRGIKLATGDYIHLAAADDIIRPGLYEKSLGLLRRHPQAAVCSAVAQYVTADGKPLRLDPPPGLIARAARYFSPAESIQALGKHGHWYTGNTGIWRRDALLDLGLLRPDLHSFADGFLFHVGAAKYGACFIPEILGDFRFLPNAMSAELHGNVELFTKRMQIAERLMRTTYADIFPTAYVDKFARDNAFRAAGMLCAQIDSKLRIEISRPLGNRLLFGWAGVLQRQILRVLCVLALCRHSAFVMASAVVHNLWSWLLVKLRLTVRTEVTADTIRESIRRVNVLSADYRRTIRAMRSQGNLFDRLALGTVTSLLSLRVATLRWRLYLSLGKRMLIDRLRQKSYEPALEVDQESPETRSIAAFEEPAEANVAA